MFADTKAFTGFSVDDIEIAKKFYGDTLGIRVSEAGMGNVALHLAGGNDVLIYPKDNHVPATFTILNFEVADIDKAIDQLVERGVTIERYDGMAQDEKGVMRGLEHDMGPNIAWFTDPAGNVLSVLQSE